MSNASTTSTVTSADGTNIVVDRQGAGPAIVLIGAGPTNRYAAMGLAGLLAEHLTVFNYDRRGRGDSGDTQPYAVEREIEDLAAVLAYAGGSAAAYGTSGGAIWAVEAAHRGLSLGRLALWEPAYITDDETTRSRPVDYPAQLAALVQAGDAGAALDLFFTTAVGMPAEMVAFMHDAPFWPQMQADATGLVYDAQLIGDFRIPTSRLATIVAPTLVIDGGTTPWLTNSANGVAGVIPGARRHTLDGQPHNVADDAIAPVIVEFVLDGSG